MRLLRRLGLLAAAAVFLLGLHCVLLAGAAPVVRRAEIRLPDWPAGAPPLTVALLSDLHVATPGDTPGRLAETVARVNALHPDLVLIAGDVLASGEAGVREAPPGTVVRALAALHPRLGTVAVLGNHDYTRHHRLEDLYAAANIRLLRNAALRVGPVTLVGVGDAFSHRDDLPAALASWRTVGGGVGVVLTHSPDIGPELPPSVHLALAGHTHCGQVRLPIVGAPRTQSRFGARYACGLVREGGRLTVIGAGLGTSAIPVRLGAAPDFWLLTLRG